jgi:hypothetical protein
MRTYTEETMSLLERIVERLKEIFAEPNYQNNLEQFVASRHPTTAAEVEHWVKVYERLETRRLGL